MAGVVEAESAPALAGTPPVRLHTALAPAACGNRSPWPPEFILTGIFVAGALVPQYTPPVARIHLSQRWLNHPPMLSGWHLFGTDAIGRDMLVRVALRTPYERAVGSCSDLRRDGHRHRCSAASRATEAAGSTR